MVKHFIKHKSEDQQISFVQFLRLHYFNGDPFDADYEEDMKLPFKTADNCCTSFSPVTCPATTSYIAPPAFFDIQREPTPLINNLNPSLFVKAIFQPPKQS